MMTYGCTRSVEYLENLHPFLLFENEEERDNFNVFARNNYSNIDIGKLKSDFFVQLEEAIVLGQDEIQALQVVIASELYSLWQREMATV